MSEYWKSTPKYWCKHCSTYVKDTKFERAQHEGTGRHQGNLRRFLRSIQDGQERGEHEKQRAKAEVDRLNQVVGGSSASASNDNATTTRKPSSTSVSQQATMAERKTQLAQLTEMGIAVPDEFRSEIAMPGDWQVVSQRRVEDTASEDALSVGIHKRKYEGQEEEEEAGGVAAGRGWGSISKRYPGARDDEVPNLDALLSGVKSANMSVATPQLTKAAADEGSARLGIKSEKVEIKNEPEISATTDPGLVKQEVSTESSEAVAAALRDVPTAEEALGAGIVFKKRKPKKH